MNCTLKEGSGSMHFKAEPLFITKIWNRCWHRVIPAGDASGVHAAHPDQASVVKMNGAQIHGVVPDAQKCRAVLRDLLDEERSLIGCHPWTPIKRPGGWPEQP